MGQAVIKFIYTCVIILGLSQPGSLEPRSNLPLQQNPEPPTQGKPCKQSSAPFLINNQVCPQLVVMGAFSQWCSLLSYNCSLFQVGIKIKSPSVLLLSTNRMVKCYIVCIHDCINVYTHIHLYICVCVYILLNRLYHVRIQLKVLHIL